MISKRDVQLGKVALKAGMIDKDQLTRCVALQKKLAKKGKKASLTTLLLKKEYITKAQLEEIVALHNERVAAKSSAGKSRRSKRAEGVDDEGAKAKKKKRRSKRTEAVEDKKATRRKSRRASTAGDDEVSDPPVEEVAAAPPAEDEPKAKRSRRSKRASKAGKSKRARATKAVTSDIGSEVESAVEAVDPAIFQSAQTTDVDTDRRRLIGCPECGKKYRVRKKQVGKRFHCRRCKYRIRVPKDLFKRTVQAENVVEVDEFLLASSDQASGSDIGATDGAVAAAAKVAQMVDKIGAENAPSIRELAKAAQNYKPSRLPPKTKFGLPQLMTIVACAALVAAIIGGFVLRMQGQAQDEADRRTATIEAEFDKWKTKVEAAVAKVQAGIKAKSPQAIGGALAELEIAREAVTQLNLTGNKARAQEFEAKNELLAFVRDSLVTKGNLVIAAGGLQMSRALEDFRQAAEATPEHEPTQLALARTRIMARQNAAAAEGLAELAKSSEAARALRGYAFERGDAPAEAEVAYLALKDPLGPVLAARAYVGARDYQKGLELLGKASGLEGVDQAAAKVVEGLAYEGRKLPKKALDAFDRAVALAGDLPQPLLHRGAFRLRQGKDSKAALKDIQGGNRLGASAWGHYLEGEARLRRVELEAALASFREVALVPDADVGRSVEGVDPFEEPLVPDYRVLAHCRLGFFDDISGNLRGAKIKCAEARNLNPFSPYAQAAIAHLDMIQAEVSVAPDAQQLLRRAFDLSVRVGGQESETNHARATGYLLLVRGALFTQTSRFKDAVAALRQASKQDPTLAAASSVLQGEANKRNSQATASRQAYRDAVRREADDEGYTLALALVAKKAKPTRIVNAAQALLLRNPYNSHAYSLRGQARVANEEVSKGLADLARAVELNPENSAAYRTRGFVFLREMPEDMRDANQAGTDFDKAIEIERAQGGVKPESLLGKALFHVEKKRSAEAVRVLDQCLAANPEFAAGFDLRARLHKKLGNLDASKKDWSRYKELK